MCALFSPKNKKGTNAISRRMQISLYIEKFWLRAFSLAVLTIGSFGPQQAFAFDVCADSDRCTHEKMTDYGITVYNENYPDVALDTETESLIKNGAGHEDEVDHSYGYTGDFVTVTHFWNADEARWDEPSGIPFINGDEPNSWQKVRQYWMRALGEFANNTPETCLSVDTTCFPTAYGPLHYLGHVAHHLGDNTIPTHAHVDAHDPLSGDDSYEDWMSQGAETDLGTQESAPDQPPGSILSNTELEALSQINYQPLAGGLDPLQAVGRYFYISPGANLGVVDTPLDKLYWLMYTTNQIADFFPSDSDEGDFIDREGWMTNDLIQMANTITSPRVSDDLDNNDCHSSAFGGCGSGTLGDYDNNFYDDDLGTIRRYSYLRGIRALAGLMRLYEETVASEPIISVDITGVSIFDYDCDDFTFLPACEAYAQVTIGGLTGRNEGDAQEVGDNSSISTPGWRWGNTVSDAAIIDTDGRKKILIQLQILDDDPDTEGLQSDDTIDIASGIFGSLIFKVDVEKCALGQANAFEPFIEGFVIPFSGTCGETITSRELSDDYVGTAAGSVTFSINIVEPPTFTTVSAGEVFTIEYGEQFKVAAGSVFNNMGTIVNNGTLIVEESGLINNAGIIVNRENIRIYNGVIDNIGVIDNSEGDHISNNGIINNVGEIFAPFDRYYGNQPMANLPLNSYYMGKSTQGSFGCRVLGGTWQVLNGSTTTFTCITQNSWLRATSSLVIDTGVSLIVNGTMNNEGSIENRGTINNSVGLIRQCGTFEGNQPTTLSQVDETCLVSVEAQLCSDYGGTWNLSIPNRCDLGTEGSDSSSCTSGGIPVAQGAALTIRNGVSWYVPCTLENFGSINIEEGGELHVTGLLNNFRDDTTGLGLDAVINNDGLISLEEQSSSGIGGVMQNDGFIYNSGIMTATSNISYIGGTGITENRCDSIFSVNRNLSIDQAIYDEACLVLDTDGDGVDNELDAFPYNPLETIDTDGDGVGDNADQFLNNALESVDSDGDGVGDNADAFPNNPEETADTDFDGIGDNNDSFPADTRLTSIVVDGSSNLMTYELKEPDSVSSPLPEGVTLTRGLVSFQLSTTNVGGEATITIIYSEPLNDEAVWWKYGPTATNTTPHWYVFDAAVISGDSVTLTITDGSIGDDDLIANGSISDPGGPGLPEVTSDSAVPEGSSGDSAVSGGSSGGGAISLWMLMLLSSLLLRKECRKQNA